MKIDMKINFDYRFEIDKLIKVTKIKNSDIEPYLEVGKHFPIIYDCENERRLLLCGGTLQKKIFSNRKTDDVLRSIYQYCDIDIIDCLGYNPNEKYVETKDDYTVSLF